MQRRTLIVNADDLGLAPSVNEAIMDVYWAGNLSSATLMVDREGTEDAMLRIGQAPDLSIGLHFVLTEGRALTGVSSVTDAGGAFLHRSGLFKRAMTGGVRPADVRKEFIAQIERMQALGRSPDHTDSHQHVMMIPPIFKGLHPVLKERSIPFRIVRPPSKGSLTGRPKRALKQLLNQWLAERAMRRRGQLVINDRLVSVHDLESPGPYGRADYTQLIERTDHHEVVELMVHPYVMSDTVKLAYADRPDKGDSFLARCVAEHRALSRPGMLSEYRLTTFKEIQRQ